MRKQVPIGSVTAETKVICEHHCRVRVSRAEIENHAPRSTSHHQKIPISSTSIASNTKTSSAPVVAFKDVQRDANTTDSVPTTIAHTNIPPTTPLHTSQPDVHPRPSHTHPLRVNPLLPGALLDTANPHAPLPSLRTRPGTTSADPDSRCPCGGTKGEEIEE